VAAENPGIRVTNVHPGVVEPLMGNKALDTGASYPIDESEGRSFTVLSNTTGRKGLC
jgi:NAD(P)-dependent dehydrogenase (short-subunit alcohol dehydrogenase family)